MPDLSYFIARSAELLSATNAIYDHFAPHMPWVERYHAFWLALYVDFVAQFGG